MKQCAEEQSIPSADINLHNREIFISNVIIQQPWQSMKYSINRGGNVSLRSMKRREGVFSPKAKKWYVHKFHASQRNILY
jgi:transposase-like protein